MTYTKAEVMVIIPGFFILLGITLLLWFFLRNQSQKVKDIPFFCIAVIILALEIVKQIRNALTEKDLWALPFHYCSTFFLWFSLAEFSWGKFRKHMQNMAFISSICLLAVFYIGPRGILGSNCDAPFSDFKSFHGLTYHHLALLYGLLGIALKRFHPSIIDGWLWVLCSGIYFIIAMTCAYTLDENYFNVLYSIIPPLEWIRVTLGQVPYLIVLATFLLFGGAAVSWVPYAIMKHRKKRTTT